MIKFAVATMVCFLGLKMIAAMPVADHHEGHAPLPVLPVVPLERNVGPLEIPNADVAQSSESATANQPAPQAPADVVDAVATRSSEEVQPVEPKLPELPKQPELPKAAAEEAVAQPKSSEEQIDSVEKEEPKVLATAEAEKKQEQESLKEAASEAKESVQPAPQPAEIPAEKKAVSFFSF